MHAVWKIFLVSAAVFGVALGADWLFGPDIALEAFADKPRPRWSHEIAFLLRAIEWTAAGVAIMALVLMLGVWAMLTRLPPDP
jgi:hypothetical protein